MTNTEIWEQLKTKHPERKRKIPNDIYRFMPEEELQLKVDKIPPKVDMS